MLSPGKGKIGRNDPCPCGSGKKYKRCCLEQQCASDNFWARQRDASDQLTRDMLRFAERKFGDQIQVAWEDFKMTDLPVPLDAYPGEQQIFMPYFCSIGTPKGRAAERERSGEAALSLDGTSWKKAAGCRSSSACFLNRPPHSHSVSLKSCGVSPASAFGCGIS